MAKQIIGIPRAFFYYIYFPAWKTFFERLGFEVITSPKTTKEILDAGVKEALAEACVPVKIYFGHVVSLRKKVDFMFVPRIISINGETIYCPKFLGMADMIKSALPNLPPVLDVTVDKKRHRYSMFKGAMELGKRLGKKKRETLLAFLAALKVNRVYDKFLKSGYTPDEAMDHMLMGKPLPVHADLQSGESTLRLALLGYPYTTHDPFISVGAIEKLKSLGVKVITSDMVKPNMLRNQAGKLVKGMFWTFSDITSKAAYHFFENVGEVDGILHLTAFGCGPDFMVDKLMEIEAKKGGKVPFMTLMIDEHTGEAGVLTRIEAFCEMVRRRKEATI